MGGSAHIATQNGWNRKKRSIWCQLGGNGIGMEALRFLAFLVNPRSAPNGFPFRSFLSVLCLGLCLLSVLCFVFSLFLVRSVFVCANPCDRDTMGHRSKTRILDPPIFAHLRFAPYNGGFMPEVWSSKNFVLLGLHTELWVEAPTSQPKTDGTGKSEAFGDNLVETALEWWKRHWNGSIALPCFSCQPPFRSQWFSVPSCMSFVLVSFGLCSLLCLLFLLGSVWLCLWKTRAIATLWGTDQKREFLILRFSHILRFAPYNGGFMPEVWNSKNFVLLGLHTELWVEAPTSQPKTDGTGKSEAFGANLVETALEWKHCASLLFLSTPVPLPMVFRSFLSVLCFGLCLLSVLCFVFSSFLVRSVFV